MISTKIESFGIKQNNAYQALDCATN